MAKSGPCLPLAAWPSATRAVARHTRVALYEEIVRRGRTLPGVAEAAIVGLLPFEGGRSLAPFTAEGGAADDRNQRATTQFTFVSPGYFAIMGIRMHRGRTFNDADDKTAQALTVISDSLARRAPLPMH